MDIYLFLFSLSLFLYFIGSISKNKIYFYLNGFILVIVSGFRGNYVGRDTAEYLRLFDIIKNGGETFINEPGYLLLVNTIAQIGGTQQLIFLLFSGLTIFCFGRFILRYSSKPYLSLLIFIFVGPFYFATFNQIRQYLAIGIFLAYILPYAENRNFLKFTISLLLTGFFAHISILILFPLYLIINRKFSFLQKTALIFGFLASMSFLVMIILKTPYAYFIKSRNELTWDLTLISIQIIICVLFLFFERRILSKDPSRNIFINMAFFSLIMLLAVVIYSYLPLEIFLRMNNYFFPFMIILIPDILRIFEKRTRVILTGSLIMILSLYYLRTTLILGEFYDLVPYEFNNIIFKF